MKAFNDPDRSDVLIKCGKDNKSKAKFHCYKLILSLSSPVFEAMFKHENTKENKTNVVKIGNFDKEAVETFLKLTYGAKTADEMVHVEPSKALGPLTLELAKEVIVLCDMYDLAGGIKRNLSNAILESGLYKDWESAKTLAMYGHKFHMPQIQKAATNAIMDFYKEFPNKSFEELKDCPDVMHDVLKAVIVKKQPKPHLPSDRHNLLDRFMKDLNKANNY